jgi:hypothetical protein
MPGGGLAGNAALSSHLGSRVTAEQNAKVAQTLAGHHSASFTLDQYADAVPEQMVEAGEKVASALLKASGSNLLAAPKHTEAE